MKGRKFRFQLYKHKTMRSTHRVNNFKVIYSMVLPSHIVPVNDARWIELVCIQIILKVRFKIPYRNQDCQRKVDFVKEL